MSKGEIQEYKYAVKIHNDYYDEINRETAANIDKANDIAAEKTRLLITLASALLAIVGGFTASMQQTLEFDAATKVLVAASITSLGLSIIAGIQDQKLTSKFFSRCASIKHEEGHIIRGSKEMNYEGLTKMVAKVDKYRAKDGTFTESPKLAQTMQELLFYAGLISLTGAIISVLVL